MSTLLILFIKGSNPFNETILNTVDIRNCLESFKAFYWVLYYNFFIRYILRLENLFLNNEGKFPLKSGTNNAGLFTLSYFSLFPFISLLFII